MDMGHCQQIELFWGYEGLRRYRVRGLIFQYSRSMPMYS